MGCKNPEKAKLKHKKGLWSPDEDLKLKNHIMKYGHGCWSSVPINAGEFIFSSSSLKKRVSKLAKEVEGKSGQLPGLEQSPSSSKSTPRNYSFESKVMFAEWLSLDQFNGGGSSSVAADLEYTFDYGRTNSGDSSVHSLQVNTEALGSEIMQAKPSFISIDELLQAPFGFEDQSGLVDYFPGDFNLYCGDLKPFGAPNWRRM